MNNRQRFHCALNKEFPDRVPLFSEGFRDETMQIWRQQGLGHKSLTQIAHIDRYELIGPELDPIPYPKTWPENLSGIKDLKNRLDPSDRRRYPSRWKQKYLSYRHHDIVTFLCVHHGFFLSMGVNGWHRFDSVIDFLGTDPGFVHAQMELYSDFAGNIAENILSCCKVDAVYFSEPIGGNDRPLLSPQMYQEFVLQSYLPVIETVKKYDVQNIILLTYGNIWPFLGLIIDAGFTCLWSCETNAPEMDYRHIRKVYGTDLGLIGGIDLDILRRDKKAIEQELEQKLSVLLEPGNYIPLADGRIREDIPLENYLFYREKLYQMVKKG